MNPYTIKAQAGGRARVDIYGDIGPWANDAGQFRRDVQALGNVPIDVHISSGGGSANDGISMHTFLASLPDVHTYADAGVASAATLPFLAGKKRYMATASSLMIHNPWDIVAGDAEAMRDAADGLEFAAARLAEVYAKVTGLASDVIRKMMNETTWIDTAQAIAEKWATDVVEGSTAQANIAPGRYKGTPKNLVLAEAPAPQPKPNTHSMNKLLTALAQAGLISSAGLAEDAAVSEFTTNIAALNKQVADAKASLATQAKANATALVEAAVADGRIKPEVKDTWVASIVANDDTAKLLAAIEKPKPATGATPMAQGTGTGNQPKTLTEKAAAARMAAGLPV